MCHTPPKRLGFVSESESTVEEIGVVLLSVASSLEWPQLLTSIRAFVARKRRGTVRISLSGLELLVSSLKITSYLVAQIMLIPTLGIFPALVSLAYFSYTVYRLHAWIAEGDDSDADNTGNKEGN